MELVRWEEMRWEKIREECLFKIGKTQEVKEEKEEKDIQWEKWKYLILCVLKYDREERSQ